MPVRSRGSLLAGAAALVGLLLAGAGCHTSPSAQNSYPGGAVQPAGEPAMPAAVPAPPSAGPVPAVPRAQAPVTLQPVPTARAAEGRGAVIASSWQPVQRVSAEQPVVVSVPTAPAAPPANGLVTPVRSPVGSAMPVGPPPGAFLGAGPVMDDKINAVTPPEVVAGGAILPPHPPGPPMPREFEKQSLPPYVVEPPDLLLIQASPAVTLGIQAIDGQHLVGPDGTINLGIYGRLYVAGMTLDQVADALSARLLQIMPGLARTLATKVGRDEKKEKDEAEKLREQALREQAEGWSGTFNTLEMIKKELVVDVLSYNSKYYYVITDGGGYGQQVYPILITGNETVLDAIAKVNGLPAVATKKKIWVARATRPGQPPKVLPVDWRSVTQCGTSETNYQIFPGDRVFVQSDGWIRFDTWLAKRLSPLQRGLGTTLLGASTVNAIKLGSLSGAGAGGLGGIGGFVR